MSLWTSVIWPFLSKFLKFLLGVFERTAQELAKRIPPEIVEPIKAKIIEVALNPTLTGPQKMQAVKTYALQLIGDKFKDIGNSALDTFLQVLYQDLKNTGVIA